MCLLHRLAAVPATVKAPLGFPYLVQLPLFAAIFGGTGCVAAAGSDSEELTSAAGRYMIHAGDPVNGSGTATAWSLTYLFLHSKRALVSKRPAPIALTVAVGLFATAEGSDYFMND